MMNEETELTTPPYNYDSPLRRNPSPLPGQNDEEDNADVIKGTGFSKSWVYSILINLVEEVKKHGEIEADGEGTECAVEVSEAQQDELGNLWDISMNSDVATFLMEPECNTIDILTGAIYKSRAPRITEICIGILGNLCSDPEICVTISTKEDLIQLICAVLSNIEFDAPTLKEAMRLVLVCLGNAEVSDRWLQAIMDTPDLISLLLFVLESAVDVDLLMWTGELMDKLMDTVEELCEAWACPELVNNILVAFKQIGHKEKDKVKPFLSIIHWMSTSQAGVESLVTHSEGVMKALVHWLREVCDEDILVIDDHLQAHICVVSVLTILFNNVPSVADHLTTKPSVLKDMLKTLDALYNIHQSCDNPAKLPHCIFAPSRLSSSHKPAANTPSSEPNADPQTATEHDSSRDTAAAATSVDCQNETSALGVDEKGEGQSEQSNGSQQCAVGGSEHGEGKEENDGEMLCSSATLYHRSLLESLQEYFRNFFAHLTLEDDSHGNGKEEGKHHVTTDSKFYHVLKHLDRCPRRHLSYLVSTLVYNIPDCSEVGTGGKGSQQDDTCAEGWQMVDDVQELCRRLHLKRAVELLTDVVSTVRLTAGMGD